MTKVTFQSLPNGRDSIIVLADGIEKGIIWASETEYDKVRWMIKFPNGTYMRQQKFDSVEEAKKAVTEIILKDALFENIDDALLKEGGFE